MIYDRLPNGGNSSDNSTALVKAADGSANILILPLVLNWLPQADITKGSLTLQWTTLDPCQINKWRNLPDTDDFINSRGLQVLFLFNVRRQMGLGAAAARRQCKTNTFMRVSMTTYGVKAPGTANKITFLFAVKSPMLILLAGESSNNSIDGILSPSCEWKSMTNRFNF